MHRGGGNDVGETWSIQTKQMQIASLSHPVVKRITVKIKRTCEVSVDDDAGDVSSDEGDESSEESLVRTMNVKQ